MTPPDRSSRRSIRLPGYDYRRAGAYFVTLCTQQRECLLGEGTPDGVILNEWGKVVDSFWDSVAAHFPGVAIDVAVTMPNHVHAIIWLAAGEAGDLDEGGMERRDMGRGKPGRGDPGRGNPAPTGAAVGGTFRVGVGSPDPVPAFPGVVDCADREAIGRGDPGRGDPAPTGGAFRVGVGFPDPVPPDPAGGDAVVADPVVADPADGAVDVASGGDPGREDPAPADPVVPYPVRGAGRGETPSLPRVVAYFKYQTTVRINRLWDMQGTRLWQRNYWEHVIRNQRELQAIRCYILDNPLRWSLDRDNPSNSPRTTRAGRADHPADTGLCQEL